jgi:tRNA (guanine37-N1)-methyltransferase
MWEKSICIQISREKGESTIRSLNKLGLINKKLKVKKNQNELFIPINHQPNFLELETLKNQISTFQILITTFVRKKQQIKTLEELISGKIPDYLLKKLPHSLDIIGDIAIIEIPTELNNYNEILGGAILKLHKNIKAVFSKSSPIKGNYRLRSFDFLCGENRTYTTHIEYGCKYFLDISKVYFSPRLSQEHNRVASFVKGNEVIVDLFAGIGPFSILIAKNNPEAKIFSIDINPVAVEFLKKNIRLNRVNGAVVPFEGDARPLINEHLTGIADRIIMNLPEKAKEFINVACKALKPKGGIIHYYEFIQEPDSIAEAQDRIYNQVKKTGRIVDEFLFAKKIRETAPYQYQVAFDFKIH